MSDRVAATKISTHENPEIIDIDSVVKAATLAHVFV